MLKIGCSGRSPSLEAPPTMNIKFLRNLDRWLGRPLLMVLAPVMWLVSPAPSGNPAETGRCTFLKLKGGGSLIVAMPALLGIRQKFPRMRFVLVCTPETQVYAELIGIFDEYSLIDDASPLSLFTSALKALAGCFRADIAIDLEPNSLLAAVFTVLTAARCRLGLVKPEESWRKAAYTQALPFNVLEPIYNYYDQIAGALGASPAPVLESRAQFMKQIKNVAAETEDNPHYVGLAPFTSDFARERMMPDEIWIDLLREADIKNARFMIFGSSKNQKAGDIFSAKLKQKFPAADVANACGRYNLAESASEIARVDAFWAVDSGLLHIARLIGVPCRSFWGPTDPRQRLRPILGLQEITIYRGFACSPCLHLPGGPLCGGNNLCMKTMADPLPNLVPPWARKLSR